MHQGSLSLGWTIWNCQHFAVASCGSADTNGAYGGVDWVCVAAAQSWCQFCCCCHWMIIVFKWTWISFISELKSFCVWDLLKVFGGLKKVFQFFWPCYSWAFLIIRVNQNSKHLIRYFVTLFYFSPSCKHQWELYPHKQLQQAPQQTLKSANWYSSSWFYCFMPTNVRDESKQMERFGPALFHTVEPWKMFWIIWHIVRLGKPAKVSALFWT